MGRDQQPLQHAAEQNEAQDSSSESVIDENAEDVQRLRSALSRVQPSRRSINTRLALADFLDHRMQQWPLLDWEGASMARRSGRQPRVSAASPTSACGAAIVATVPAVLLGVGGGHATIKVRMDIGCAENAAVAAVPLMHCTATGQFVSTYIGLKSRISHRCHPPVRWAACLCQLQPCLPRSPQQQHLRAASLQPPAAIHPSSSLPQAVH